MSCDELSCRFFILGRIGGEKVLFEKLLIYTRCCELQKLQYRLEFQSGNMVKYCEGMVSTRVSAPDFA